MGVMPKNVWFQLLLRRLATMKHAPGCYVRPCFSATNFKRSSASARTARAATRKRKLSRKVRLMGRPLS